MTTADATVARPAATTLPRKKIRWGEQFVHAVLFVAAAISVLTTVGIVVSLVLPSLDFFREVEPDRLLHRHDVGAAVPRRAVRCPAARRRHVRHLVLVGAGRVPARGSASRSTSASTRARGSTSFLKPILEILAAIPTVVLGYFALTFVTPFLRDQLGVQVEIFNALCGEPRARGHAHPDGRDALRGRDGRRPARSARRRLRARRRQAAGVDEDRRAGCRLGDHRGVRARVLARGRRDDDRPHRRRTACADHVRSRASRSRRSRRSSVRPATATSRPARSSTRRSSRSASRSS